MSRANVFLEVCQVMQKASFAALVLASSLAASALLPIGCSTGEADSLFDTGTPGSTEPTGSTTGTGGSGGKGGSGSTSSGTGGSGMGGMGGSGMGGMGNGGMGGSGMGGMGGMGGGGPTGEILCANNMTCPTANQGACCWFEQDDTGDCVDGPPDQAVCNQGQQGGHTRIECQSDADCTGGQLCCGDRASGSFGTYYWQVVCKDQCDDVTMCPVPGPDPNCPMVNCQGNQVQGECNPSQLLPNGYYVCGCP